jgi:uncharacterized membrane protein
MSMTPAKKLLIALGAMIGFFFMAILSEWLLFLSFFSFIAAVMYSLDVAAELKSVDNPTTLQRALRILFAIPQFILAVLALLIGLSIVVWVLYNTFVERMPQYTGGFLSFGIAPLMLLVGAGWLYSLIRRKSD